MFGRSKKKEATPTASNPSNTNTRKSTPSVVSADMNVLGNIISEGFLDINGRIEGNVKCHSTTIRENGLVQGDVIAENIQIYGEVKGLVKAKTVHLYASGRVTGVIMHESLSIEDGAFVDGKFKRTDRIFIDEDERDTSFSMDSSDDSTDDLDFVENNLFFEDDDDDHHDSGSDTKNPRLHSADDNRPDESEPKENVLDNLRLIST